MIKDSFNVSGKKTDTQKLNLDEEARNQKIQQIQDPKTQESLYKDRAIRDAELQKMKESNTQKEKKAIEEGIQKKIANKAEMHLRPKHAPRPTPQQMESEIRQSVRATLGTQLDEKLKNKRTALNTQMDKKIDTALSRQAEPIKQDKNAEFSKNAEDITRARKTSRGRGRSR